MRGWPQKIEDLKKRLKRRLGFRSARSQRGQAMTETALMTVLLVVWGGVLTRFFPDALNSIQIYMDGFYYLFSLPIP